MRRVPVLVVLGVVAVHLVLVATPAYACSCRADVQVAEMLANSDGAFVGKFVGREIPPQGQAINHFEVERVIKGDIGRSVRVASDASGASCGLELEPGERTGLFLAGTPEGWVSSLCAQTAPAPLLAVAPALRSEPGASVRGLFVAAGVLALLVGAYFVVDRVRRRRA